jgi:hypothetical protein
MRVFCLGVVAMGGLCFLNACGGGNPPPPPLVATQFSISAPGTAIAGTAFQISVRALDASNNVVASYSGTVHFSSSDSQAVLPANSALTNGTGTFSVTFKTAIGQTITVAGTGTASITGTSNAVNVGAGAAAHLSVNAPNAATAALPFNFTVTAFDAYTNVANSYSGTVHFSTNDSQAVLPPNSALTNGMGTFPATLKTIANATITATDTTAASLTGNSSMISVVSNAVTHILIATMGSATSRAPISLEVKALDAADNISAGYAGKVHFTSTDGKAILPADTALPSGIGNLSATLETAGNQTITATDTVTAAVTGISNSISVSAAAALTISSGAPPDGTVGVSYGSSTTENFRCFFSHIRGPHWECSPCSSSVSCTALPPCNGNIFRSPCLETRHVFTGFAFKATGGVPPYRWSAASLPPGLSVNSQNGEITGIPTLADSYPVAVTVADSGTPQLSTNPNNYTILVKNPPPPVINTTPAPPAGAVNLPYSFTFTASSTATPLIWRESGGTLPSGLTLSQGGALSGTPTAAGTSSFTLITEDSFKQDSAAQNFTIQIFPHGFKATGSMATARAHYAATLLNSGKVLVTGGLDTTGNPLATAEIYDPTAGTFSPTPGSMTIARASHTATLLNTGKVLVAGWGNAIAELFDPATGMFTATGSMAAARVSHTATLLNNGKVLVTGGIGAAMAVLTEAELYDPITGSFSPTLGSMATSRQWHTASLLAGGKVLVTGGLDGTGQAIATAELFDPTNQTFTTTTGSMASARAFQTATVLKDGTVLVTGGDPPGAVVLATAELYDPTSQTFAPTGSMGTARASHTATLLDDGRVLITGGTDGVAVATAEVYQ